MNTDGGRATRNHFLVVGGGALGLLLADALRHLGPVASGRASIEVFNRRELPPEIVISKKNPQTSHRLAIQVHYGGATEWLKSSGVETDGNCIIFLCVSPEDTEDVFLDWVNVLAGTAFRHHVQFVFCNNGIISEKVREKIKEHSELFSFLRAIFYVGAVREIRQNQCNVVWAGGDLVRWASLSDLTPTALKACHLWMGGTKESVSGFRSGESRSVGFLQWQADDNGSRLEREKFFTNFVLGAVIGPNLSQNRTVFEKLTAEFISQLAEQFEILWGWCGLSATMLVNQLESTVRATAENYNSLSLQGANGRISGMLYFLNTLEVEMADHRPSSQLKPLVEFIRRTKTIWGISA